ncbi:MAG TPA: hypothetical protein PLV41_11555, partial [Miltoncostaeales bacterium]|nr:hypothetical protein [Miltoncostaeales bacterium]
HLGNANFAGVAMALWAIGSAIGGFTAGTIHSTAPLATRLTVLAALCGVGFMPAAFSPNIWTLSAAALVAGLAIAPLLATIYESIGQIATPGTETEAFSWLNVAFPIGFSIAAPIAGFLADGPGPRVGAATSGIAVLLGAALISRRASTLLATPSAAPTG